ncbi:MAG: cupredoxin family copper-binding protein [Methanosarcina sp.]|uniref:cupredoxin domain-containing protein n=1 Tax=Methanosarcina sp. TaxID=2213 RepID=UPI0026179BA1|nr:cupredoxin family copper-binding protein [Methanosarcina sp.]MDD3247206.1 cupredoxin family copper-binding protein [Methanosarcina sp.]
MRKEIIIFLVMLGILFVAGCAENGGSEEPAPSTPVEEPVKEVDTGEVAGEEEETVTVPESEQNETGAKTEIVDVEIRDYKYIPESLNVNVGQTVRWTNYDSVLHDVVGSGIESEYLRQGETFTYTFEQEGTYDYICTIHPWMEGEVIAEA